MQCIKRKIKRTPTKQSFVVCGVLSELNIILPEVTAQIVSRFQIVFSADWLNNRFYSNCHGIDQEKCRTRIRQQRPPRIQAILQAMISRRNGGTSSPYWLVEWPPKDKSNSVLRRTFGMRLQIASAVKISVIIFCNSVSSSIYSPGIPGYGCSK